MKNKVLFSTAIIFCISVVAVTVVLLMNTTDVHRESENTAEPSVDNMTEPNPDTTQSSIEASTEVEESTLIQESTVEWVSSGLDLALVQQQNADLLSEYGIDVTVTLERDWFKEDDGWSATVSDNNGDYWNLKINSDYTVTVNDNCDSVEFWED